jgi:uncharacterized protein YndB with AHSA1/START domain
VAKAETAAVVEREISIAADPDTVFDFFTDPDRMIQWMGRKAELDPRPGGIFRVDLNGKHISRGEFVEVERPNRIVFTFGWEGDTSIVKPGASTVEVTLTAEDGGTLMRFVHRDLPEESRDSHGHGWDHYLARMEIAGRGGDAGEDPWADPEMAGG